PGDRVLLVRGDLADPRLPELLRARGASVDEVVGYRTLEAPDSSRSILREALTAGPPAAVVFASGSSVRGLVALAEHPSPGLTSIPAVCIGHETGFEAERHGFRVAAIARRPDPTAIAGAVAAALRTAAPQP